MRGRDYSRLLIWSAVVVTVVRYMGAFLASDVGSIEGGWSEILTVLMGITGIGMGILDTLGGAYLFDGWRSKMPKSGQRWPFRFKVLTIFVFGLFMVGLVILVPFTVSRVSHKSMYDILGDGQALWMWSLAVNLAPYILVGGVATSHRIISSDLDNTSESSFRSNSGSGRVSKVNSRSSRSSSVSMGRPSIHQEKVFQYMEHIYKTTGEVPTFTEVMQQLGLSQSTASRLRNEWLDAKQ